MTPDEWVTLFWTLTLVTGFSGLCAVMGWIADKLEKNGGENKCQSF